MSVDPGGAMPGGGVGGGGVPGGGVRVGAVRGGAVPGHSSSGAADDGRADPRLVAALAADDGSPAARSEVLAALVGARVFLALAARAVDRERAPVAEPVRESGAQLSLLSLRVDSGARALPVFADGHQVQRWQECARPRPVTGPLACATALEDSADVLLLDPLGAAIVVRGSALRELAAGRVPVAGAALSTRREQAGLSAGAPADPALVAALGRALAGEPVSAARLLAGPDGPALVVTLDASPTPAALVALADRVRQRLGPDLPPDGLDLAALPDDGRGEPVPLVGRPAPTRRPRLRLHPR